MADDFLYGMSRQLNRNYEGTLKEWKKHAAKLQGQIQELNQNVIDYKFGIDKRDAHLQASLDQNKYLMGLLDEAYGKDNNPARQAAYADPDEMRIPSGSRKGEVVTVADHMYLSSFIKTFKSKYAEKWKESARSWKEFLHSRISY